MKKDTKKDINSFIFFIIKAYWINIGSSGRPRNVSEKTTSLTLFWTYSCIIICVEPNDLARAYCKFASYYVCPNMPLSVVIHTGPSKTLPN